MARSGRPLKLAVRAPENFEMCLSIGIDLRAWLSNRYMDYLLAGGGDMLMDLPIEETVAL